MKEAIVEEMRSPAMLNLRQNLAVFLASSTLSFIPIVLAAWPYETQADDPQAAAAAEPDIGLDTSKIGALEAKSHLVKDPGPQNKWYLEVEIKNPQTEGPESGSYEVAVRKVTYNETMGRSGPIPTVAFSRREQVTVPPGETVVRRYALPATLCFQLANMMRRSKAAEAGSGPGPQTNYFTSIQAPDPVGTRVGAANARVRSKLAMVPNSPDFGF
jgi:hypothetical protein